MTEVNHLISLRLTTRIYTNSASANVTSLARITFGTRHANQLMAQSGILIALLNQVSNARDTADSRNYVESSPDSTNWMSSFCLSFINLALRDLCITDFIEYAISVNICFNYDLNEQKSLKTQLCRDLSYRQSD